MAELEASGNVATQEHVTKEVVPPQQEQAGVLNDLSRMGKVYDIVIFGASGFTGQFVVEELARTVERELASPAAGGGVVKWAIAGRNRKKLQDVLSAATDHTGKRLTDIPIIIADVGDEQSLKEMCQQAAIVINCVGPYRFYGTAVVKACIENCAHHIDICGEPAWLEEIELKYSQKAKEAGVFILQACGFDSIPSELGLEYTKRQFDGVLSSVEAYVKFNIGSEQGPVVNYGTWLSAVHGVANHQELKAIRQQAGNKQIPKPKHKLRKRYKIDYGESKFSENLKSQVDRHTWSPIFYSDDVHSWCVPFLGADKSVVYRSTIYNYEQRHTDPVQFQPYLRCGSFFQVVCTVLAGIFFFILTKFSFGRELLEKYPEKMSLGRVSTKGPSRKHIEETTFDITFVGVGHERAKGTTNVEKWGPVDKKIVTSISGPEMGYLTTPICAVQAAYTLMSQQDNFPKGGGVFTPGSAFAETKLLARLQEHNIKFAMVEK